MNDKPKRLNAEEIADRNHTIRRLRARGVTLQELAKKFSITRRQIFKILKRGYAERLAEIREDNDALLASIAEGYEEDIRELSVIASGEGEPGAVRVGALKGRVEARTRWVDVLQSLGLIPKKPHVVQVNGLSFEDAARLLRGGESDAHRPGVQPGRGDVGAAGTTDDAPSYPSAADED